jgi:cilia- and flagella-associated protein 44
VRSDLMRARARAAIGHQRARVQMLKFGREINFDLLDRLGPSPGADELAAQLHEQERSLAADLKDWDRKIAARTEELVALTQENTAHLHTVAELTSQQRGLEEGVRKTRKELANDPVATRRREVAERDHLVQMVNAQAREIEHLRSQVTILRRKDTSVYS